MRYTKIEDFSWKNSNITIIGVEHSMSNVDSIVNEMEKRDFEIVLIETGGTNELNTNDSASKALVKYMSENGNVKWYRLEKAIEEHRALEYSSKSNQSLKKVEKEFFDKDIEDLEKEDIEFRLKIIDERDFKSFLNIASKVEENYKNILVLCGKDHVEGIIKHFENDSLKNITQFLS